MNEMIGESTTAQSERSSWSRLPRLSEMKTVIAPFEAVTKNQRSLTLLIIDVAEYGSSRSAAHSGVHPVRRI